MEKFAKIYILKDPRNGKIRYIGKTIIKLKYRLSGHISESKKTPNSNHRNSWITSLLRLNLKPDIELLEEVPIEDWKWVEIYWIAQFKSWGFDLVNTCEGGFGGGSKTRSQEAIEKTRQTLLEGIKSGRISYKERSSKISKALKGKLVNDSTKEKLRLINLGKKYSEETKYKKSNGGVLQYTKDNELVGEYKSLTDAAEKTGFFRGNISSACTGRLKTYKGFIWKYKGKDIVDA